MIPSRGLRWSRQTIALTRSRLEPLSVRHCSTLGRNAPVRSSPLLSRNAASTSRIYSGKSSLRMSPLVRSAGGVRFASTGPVSAASSASAPETASSIMATQFKPASLEGATDLTGSMFDMPVHIGYLKSLGLDYGWGPTSAMEWLIEHVHVYAGTPWWASIALAAIAVRAILFKVHIDAADNAARMQAVKPITQPLTDKMMAARGDQIEVLKIRAEIQAINKRAGIKIWKSLLPMVQIFTGYGTWTILRAMSHLPVPGMDNGGALWFHNLTIPDPYFILPASTAFALYWVLKKGGETGSSAANPQVMKVFQVLMPGVTLAVTAFLPASVQVSFFVSGILSLIQSILLRRPAVRKFFKLYPIKTVRNTATGPSSEAMNVRVPPTQAQLNSSYKQARPVAPQAGEDGVVKRFVKSTVQGATKDIRTTISEAVKSGREIAGQGKEGMAKRQAKADRAAAAAYEAKRQKEIQAERRQREEDRRARRAARDRRS